MFKKIIAELIYIAHTWTAICSHSTIINKISSGGYPMSNMFCFQCQQTAGNKACVNTGVCGKQPSTKKRQIPNFCPDTWTTENPLTVCWSMVYLQHLQMWILMINQSKITSKKCRKTRRISCAVCLQTYVAYQISHIRTSRLQIWIHKLQIWISQIQIWIHQT